MKAPLWARRWRSCGCSGLPSTAGNVEHQLDEGVLAAPVDELVLANPAMRGVAHQRYACLKHTETDLRPHHCPAQDCSGQDTDAAAMTASVVDRASRRRPATPSAAPASPATGRHSWCPYPAAPAQAPAGSAARAQRRCG